MNVLGVLMMQPSNKRESVSFNIHLITRGQWRFVFFFTCFFNVNVVVMLLKKQGEEVIVNQEQRGQISLQNCIKQHFTSKQKKQTRTCCIVVVQYLAVTLTIINIHETATLQPLRMVKLIMLTGSFNCFIQSKQFSCNKWHNNYAHNLTGGQWQVEEWHTHLHKVQRIHSYARTRNKQNRKIK